LAGLTFSAPYGRNREPTGSVRVKNLPVTGYGQEGECGAEGEKAKSGQLNYCDKSVKSNLQLRVRKLEIGSDEKKEASIGFLLIPFTTISENNRFKKRDGQGRKQGEVFAFLRWQRGTAESEKVTKRERQVKGRIQSQDSIDPCRRTWDGGTGFVKWG